MNKQAVAVKVRCWLLSAAGAWVGLMAGMLAGIFYGTSRIPSQQDQVYQHVRCWLLSAVGVWVVLMASLLAGIFYGTSRIQSQQDQVYQHVREVMELGYFLGHRDALNGKVRLQISTNDTNQWVWTESPWDDGTKPRLNSTKMRIRQ